MTHFDCHFHTTMSDGLYTPEQAINEAKRLGLDFIACTNHDYIDREFVEMTKAAGMDGVQAVEISTRDIGTPSLQLTIPQGGGSETIHSMDRSIPERGIHLTTYCNQFSKRVDEMLDGVNAGKREKIRQQLAKLRLHGFQIDDEEFSKYWAAKWMNLMNVGNGHIVRFLFPQETEYSEQYAHNLQAYGVITGKKEVVLKEFHLEHLKDTGSNPFGAVKIPEYEPTLHVVNTVLATSHTVRSIAHSHINYADLGPEIFEKHAINLTREKLINALEIHASAPKEWVSVCLSVAKQTGILLTFGSDCHFESHKSTTHAWLGTLNTHVDEVTRVREYQRFREYLDGKASSIS